MGPEFAGNALGLAMVFFRVERLTTLKIVTAPQTCFTLTDARIRL
jgi:hypothetical protein